MLTNTRVLAAISIFCCALTAQTARAETLYFLGNPKGKDISIPLDPSMAGKTIGVYASAPSHNHQIVDISVIGTGGEKVTVETFVAAGKQSAAAAAADTTVPALIYQGSTSYKQLTVWKPGDESSSSSSSSSSTIGADGDPACGCLSPSKIEEYLALYRTGFPNSTKEQMCMNFPQFENCSNVGGGGGSSSGGSSSSGSDSQRTVEGSSYLSFNKCLPAAKHGALVKIDLTNVDPANLEGKELTVSTLIREFKGGKKATVKPKSDGRYSPQPLFLAEPTGGYFFDKNINVVTMVNWKNKKRVKARPQKVVAFIYYGALLLEVPLGNLMNGSGKGTFEITTAAEGYSVCAKFSRTRQYFNGYKNF